MGATGEGMVAEMEVEMVAAVMEVEGGISEHTWLKERRDLDPLNPKCWWVSGEYCDACMRSSPLLIL
jgi:hypothetical protein